MARPIGPTNAAPLNLWALKSFFLFYWAAYACTAPYLPLFAHESLGLNSREFGIIFAIVPFVTTLCRPVIGYVADLLRAHRSTLVVCLILQLSFVLGLYFIKPQPWDTGVEFRATCLIDSNYKNQLGLIEAANNRDDVALAFGPRCGKTVRAKCVFPSCNDTSDWQCPRRTAAERLTFVRNESFVDGEAGLFATTKPFDYCQMPSALGSALCSARPCATALVVRLSGTFWLFFILLMFARIGINSAMSLSDAIAYDLIGSTVPAPKPSISTMADVGVTSAQRHNAIHRERLVRMAYGRNRVFGTLGYAITSVLVGLALDKFSDAPAVDLTTLLDVNKKELVDYGFSFYMHTVATGLAILAALFLVPLLSSKKSENSLENLNYNDRQQQHSTSRGVAVAKTVCQFRVLTFLICTLFIGMSSGILFAFLAWYMSSDLRSSRLNIGVAFMVQSFIEAPILIMSGTIINRIGHHMAHTISLFAFGLRFLAYAIIGQPWLILLVELLHGPCFGLFYPNMVSFACSIARTRTDIRATLQGVISAVWVLGIGVGSIVGGFLHGYFGSRFMWTTFGVGAIVVSVLHGLLAAIGSRRKKRTSSASSSLENRHQASVNNDDDKVVLDAEVPLQMGDIEDSIVEANHHVNQQPSLELDGPGNIGDGGSLVERKLKP